MTIRRRNGIGLSLLLVVAAAACGGHDRAQSGPTTTTTSIPASPDGQTRPPAKSLDLAPIYGAQLARLGLRLTDRGGLIDVSGDGYAPSPNGTHLALYVEPIGTRTVAQYIEGIRAVPLVFADLFRRWPSLESYDVCQEPIGTDGTTAAEPVPVTQIALTKAQAGAIEWSSITVADLVKAAHTDPPEVGLSVDPTLSAEPAFTKIVHEALGT